MARCTRLHIFTESPSLVSTGRRMANSWSLVAAAKTVMSCLSRTQDQNRLLFVPTQKGEAVRFPRVWMTIERAQGKPPPCPPDSS